MAKRKSLYRVSTGVSGAKSGGHPPLTPPFQYPKQVTWPRPASSAVHNNGWGRGVSACWPVTRTAAEGFTGCLGPGLEVAYDTMNDALPLATT